MKRSVIISVVLLLFLTAPISWVAAADGLYKLEMNQQWQGTGTTEQGEITGQAYRSGRGTFSGGRSPGATRGGTTTPGRAPANVTTNPRTTPNVPNTTRGGWGGIFGGFAAGALLGSLFNPFGFMGFGPGAGSPLSIIGLLFWGVIIYLVYRFFTRSRRNQS
ncbi:hypothetical protein DVH26_01620 [Paenibacillus sp. H1-7]|uniref:hypothetical protein n=1 Tax=Paenibacillus sp. H1-7 TaxID=2282849 RepID=UPI001EF93375|nr:hypothetical protein [Paenibacillus sp. H1-7]ULL13285.1 hypothetical protein DVH26_01620 [Paenibacillus sp. H1-7]